MMKRKYPSSSSSSSSCSSSSSEQPIWPDKKPDSKRVRAKKKKNNLMTISAHNSAKSRSSIYRGVTRHRWTGRYEAHLWDKTTWNSIQNKRGRQIYLGAYDIEEDAARTYDLAALKYWGAASCILNYPVSAYSKEVEEMEKLSKEEYLASLRRRSSGFSRGVSKYRGVARHHHNGRWEARIGRVCGNKYLYLGTYGTQEEAAAAYDMAAIEFRGPNAVTNFDISNYANKLTKIEEVLPIYNNVEAADEAILHDQADEAKLKLEMIDDDNSTIGGLNQVFSSSDHHDDDPYWDLICFDMIGFNILQIPDIPLEKAALDEEIDDYKGLLFEDDIECIFDDYNDDQLMSIGCNNKAEAEDV